MECAALRFTVVWHAADSVAGMIENPLSPTTCHQSHHGLMQLSAGAVQATEAIDLPQLDGVTIPAVGQACDSKPQSFACSTIQEPMCLLVQHLG